MFVTNDIKYVGVNDNEIDLFEGQYIVPNGMSYNSYIILDEKTAVVDSVDNRFCDEWICNIKKIIGNKNPDYLIVQHMEPDHSSSIADFVKEYPETVIVSSARSFPMMKNFFGEDFKERQLVVGEGDTLCLGKHTLTFLTAPMVHWPEVIVTYDSADKILFSADGFGKFGAIGTDEDWACEARRYYFGIVGKYGAQVQALLKKAQTLDIKIICPLHGPVLNENVGYYLEKYDIWSRYEPEDKGIAVCYTSVYGNTKKAVLELVKVLEEKGQKVSVFDLARDDIAEAVEDAFRYDRLVLATTTYNGDIFPFMKTFIHHLLERNYSKRFVAFIENGTWAAQGERIMKSELEKCKDLTFAENKVSIKSAMNENNHLEIKALAEELCD